MQIANVSSTLGSIGDKAQYIKNDEARKANPFASKIVAYKMAKVRYASTASLSHASRLMSDVSLIPSSMRPFPCPLSLTVLLMLVAMCKKPTLTRAGAFVLCFVLTCCFRLPLHAQNDGGHFDALQAALNMQTMSLAADLKDDGITVICYCPGW